MGENALQHAVGRRPLQLRLRTELDAVPQRRPGEGLHVVRQLGWEPEVSFEELVTMMVESDLRLLSRSARPEDEPFSPDHW